MDINDLGPIINAGSMAELLLAWMQKSPHRQIKDKNDLQAYLSADIAKIDNKISEQLNHVIHQAEYKKLESAWRGLAMLAYQPKYASDLKLKLLNVSWEELHKDVSYVLSFEQSKLFKKVYSDEYDSPGGEPYGLLIGDYSIRIQGDYAPKDLEVLRGVSLVAASAFAPFIAGLDAQSLKMDSFYEVSPRINFIKLFQTDDYQEWASFREKYESRYVGLVAPRFLLRKPFRINKNKGLGFCFNEDKDSYLWGNPCYAFASVVINSYARTSWFNEMRDYNPETNIGGVVRYSPLHSAIQDTYSEFDTLFSTEARVDDQIEWQLGQAGILVLSHIKQLGAPVFYNSFSTYKCKVYKNNQAATNNEKISSEMQYILHVSRFMHYVKVIMREKIGAMLTADDLKVYINNWLIKYVASNEVDPGLINRYPLRSVSVELMPITGSPGAYQCILYLVPRIYMEGMKVSVSLNTVFSLNASQNLSAVG